MDTTHMIARLLNGAGTNAVHPFDAWSVATSRRGTDRGQIANASGRHAKQPRPPLHPRLSIDLIVERSNVVQSRKQIVSLAGRALECLICAPLHGSACTGLHIDLVAGSEETMNRILNSIKRCDRTRLPKR
jgi:hypothetical protein